MIIIFEGNEGAGKTTQANLIAKFLNTKVLKRSSHKNWDDKTDDWRAPWDLNESALYDWRFFLEMINPLVQDGQVFIVDRSFITQEVYHKTFWPKNLIEQKHLDAYESYAKMMSKIPHIIFHIDRDTKRLDDETLIKDYNATPESFKKIDMLYDDYYLRQKELLNIVRIKNDSTIEKTQTTILEHFLSKYDN